MRVQTAHWLFLPGLVYMRCSVLFVFFSPLPPIATSYEVRYYLGRSTAHANHLVPRVFGKLNFRRCITACPDSPESFVQNQQLGSKDRSLLLQ